MTEAERIEIDEQRNAAAMFLELQRVRAENKRLQQLIKEKEIQLKHKSKAHLYVAEKLSEANDKLKSAQELNRELVNDIGKLIQKLIVRHNGTSAIIKIVNELEYLLQKAKQPTE